MSRGDPTYTLSFFFIGLTRPGRAGEQDEDNVGARICGKRDGVGVTDDHTELFLQLSPECCFWSLARLQLAAWELLQTCARFPCRPLGYQYLAVMAETTRNHQGREGASFCTPQASSTHWATSALRTAAWTARAE